MEQSNKRYTFSKIIIMIFSLIELLNGIGLIIAGKRTKKSSWIFWGITYMVVEWICYLFEIGGNLPVWLYYISIIHTALICTDYENILNQRNERAQETIQPSIPKEEVSIVSDIPKGPDASEKIAYDNLRLNIGTASVRGESRDKLKIRVQSRSGKIYEFDTNGNRVETFAADGRKQVYGGR